MIRSTIRTLLRRQIMEVTVSQWSDAVLNDLINVAYHVSQKEIMKVDPEAFLEWVRRDLTVADGSFYPRPEGSWWPNQVRMKNQGSSRYEMLQFKPFDEAETWGIDSSGKPTGDAADPAGHVWARRGNYVCIFPAPTATITAGLELIHVPTLILAVDTDIPAVPLGVHIAIVYIAKVLALGETYQNFERDLGTIERILGDLSAYYAPTGGQHYTFQPSVIKPIGYAG